MGTIQFDVRHPSGKRESVLVEAERALVGSASYCDVRLPMEDSAPEQVLIEAVGGTLRAEAKVESPAALIDGMPFAGRVLPPGSVLAIGHVRLFVAFVPDFADRPQAAAETKAWHPALPLAIFIPLLVGAYLLLTRAPDGIAPPPATTPQLFTSAVAACPHAEPAQAIAFAEEQRALAHSKRERLPFVAADGVAAVGLYQAAAACFHRGEARARAREAEEAAVSLKTSLTEEFHARRLRLSHVLKVEDYAVAAKDVGVLRALTRDQRGPYVEWLTAVAKQLAAKTAAATKTAKRVTR